VFETRSDPYIPRFPIDGQLAKSVKESFLFDHCEVSLAALLGIAVVVPHGTGQLLVVHPHTPVALHETPGSGKLVGVVHPEDSERFIYPADDPGIVEPVVEEVSDEDIDGREGYFKSMASGSTTFTHNRTIIEVWLKRR
jgi:hypothetical protein